MKKMTEKQLRALGVRILSADIDLDQCDGDRVQLMIKDDPEFPSRLMEIIKTYEVRVPKILEIVNGQIHFPGSKKFVASEHFRKDNPKVKFWDFGSNFASLFIPKTEKNVEASSLRRQKLLKNSSDSEIIKALGGEEKAETSLAEFYARLEAQGNGEEGPLLTNGNWNIFYIRDKDGVLHAVFARWLGGGWYVDADDLGYGGWYEGRRVFSRN